MGEEIDLDLLETLEFDLDHIAKHHMMSEKIMTDSRLLMWTILAMGYPNYPTEGGAGRAYRFSSQQKLIVATGIAVKALSIWGGQFNSSRFNFFPQYRKISVALADSLKARYIRGNSLMTSTRKAKAFSEREVQFGAVEDGWFR